MYPVGDAQWLMYPVGDGGEERGTKSVTIFSESIVCVP